jgi:hypothetical protein
MPGGKRFFRHEAAGLKKLISLTDSFNPDSRRNTMELARAADLF